MRYLLFTSALTLSGIAAYFSIVGLTAIFPGSVVSIIVMALALEVAKIITAVWTHRHWKQISKLAKTYLTFAVFILAVITSAGIFGFLSKSHIEHSSSASYMNQQIDELDRKIKLEEDKISRNEAQIKKLNDSTLSSEESSEDKAKIIQSNIDLLYSRLDKESKSSSEKIQNLNNRLSELDNAMNALLAEKTGFFSSNTQKIKNLQESQSEERKYIASEIIKINEYLDKLKKEMKLSCK